MRMKAIFTIVVATGLGIAGLKAHKTTSMNGTHFHGTSIMHRYLKMEMTYTGADSENAPGGKLQVKHNQQGKADREQMMLKLDGLEGDTTYYLMAWMGDEVDPMELTSFTTASNGKGWVKFKRKLQGNKGKNGSKFDLPNLKAPVDEIRKLAVVDDPMSMEYILEADLETPDKFRVLIKRELTNDGVDGDAEGVLELKAKHNSASFRLRVGNLDPDTEYHLAINGENLEEGSIMTDENGGLDTTTILDVPLDIFQVDTLSIRNADEEDVLSTEIP